MADKKISALTAVADADIGSDDLLHIVDNPGGTPNKKMTIGQLFENIPTHLAVDDITTVTATASNLGLLHSQLRLIYQVLQVDVAFTLDNGTDVGQLKLIYQKTEPASSHAATLLSLVSEVEQVQVTKSLKILWVDAVICVWDGSNWYILANFNSTVTLS